MMSIMRNGAGAAAAVFGVGYMGYMLMPAQISALIERFGITDGQAGLLATLQLGALASLLFISAKLLNRYSGKQLAIWGCILTALGHFGGAMFSSYSLVQAAMVLAGAGMGMALAGGNSMISSMRSPDRAYAGSLAIGQFSAALLLILIVPIAAEKFGQSGPFYVLALWTLLMLVLILSTNPSAAQQNDTEPSPSLILFFSAPVIALFLVGFSDASVWPFTGEIGDRLGLEGAQIETVQGLALVAGIIGAITASIIGTKFGRLKPMVLGSIGSAILYFCILNAPNSNIYSASQIFVLFFFGFSIPYFFGICAEMDSKGRVMTAAAGMQMIGLAAGPWLGGMIMQSMGARVLGAVVAIAFLCALFLALKGMPKKHSGT